jgi:hypothetical protein
MNINIQNTYITYIKGLVSAQCRQRGTDKEEDTERRVGGEQAEAKRQRGETYKRRRADAEGNR